MHGGADPARCITITRAVTLDFFDWYLKGAARHAWQDRTASFAGLRRVDLTDR